MSLIAILEDLNVEKDKLEELKKPFIEKGHQFKEFNKTTDEDTLIQQLQGVDVVILANMPLSDRIIQQANDLKYIDVAFTGVDHIGLQACKQKGIHVSNASGYSNEAVAELAIGMAITLLRNIREVEQRCRNHGTKDGLVGTEIKGKTVGIIGMGKIGSRSAELFHAFGANILSPEGHHHAQNLSYIQYASEEELYQKSDIVVLHCPLNDSTRGMVNQTKLSMMKSSAILINLARGPVVNTDDLIEALNIGVIAGAGLDVFDTEPPLSNDLPIMHAKNTLLTPHIAYASKEAMITRAEIVFNNLKDWFDGKVSNQIL